MMRRRDLMVLAAISVFAPEAVLGQEIAHRAVFWRDGDPGQRLHIRGRVTDMSGRPIAGASVSIRQADGTATYIARYQGVVVTDERGEWFLISALPGQYTGNKHIHLYVDHPDHAGVSTEILFKGDSDHTDPAETIALEEAVLNGETVLLGRFEVKLAPG